MLRTYLIIQASELSKYAYNSAMPPKLTQVCHLATVLPRTYARRQISKTQVPIHATPTQHACASLENAGWVILQTMTDFLPPTNFLLLPSEQQIRLIHANQCK